ncbi:MarR family winged helix-turn-helix transcriptional regulator [Bacillus solimangrovi]|uniref:Transcriptional regulator n=1 Tax=Bacillus solimangrovi TaxID=1305675 RepID=A0A1E5LI80_9BACI|nr:MarR family transcriptional regulator [Bacillus solimangrovi]OEH93792.1 transcriptional regulator [Bacillus solimangrovi]
MDFKLDESVGYLIALCSSLLERELHRRFRSFDVTPEQWAVLNRLWEQDGLTPKQLAEKTFKDQSNTTRILSKLEKKDIIIRKSHPKDQRSHFIFLTEQGKSLKSDLVPIAVDVLEKALEGIPKENEEELKKLLKQIDQNLL